MYIESDTNFIVKIEFSLSVVDEFYLQEKRLLCFNGFRCVCVKSGFDEVFCPCGATVQEPPIPCGKPPPVCHRPCSRMHPCEHEGIAHSNFLLLSF